MSIIQLKALTYIRNRNIIHCQRKKKKRPKQNSLLFYSQLTCKLINVSRNIFYPQLCQQAHEKTIPRVFSLYVSCMWLDAWPAYSGGSGGFFVPQLESESFVPEETPVVSQRLFSHCFQ